MHSARSPRNFFDILYRLRAVLLLAPLLVLAFANDQVIDIAHEYLGSRGPFPDRFDFALVTLVITAALPLLFILFILDARYTGESRYSLGQRLGIGAVFLLPMLPG